MDKKSDDFLRALLCLDINALNLRVLIYWCSNPYDEAPIEKAIARGLSIHEAKVEKAFKSLLSKGVLEINGLSSSGNIRYAISRQTWARIQSWKLTQDYLNKSSPIERKCSVFSEKGFGAYEDRHSHISTELPRVKVDSGLFWNHNEDEKNVF